MNDVQWSSFVYWTVAATFEAAELNIKAESANDMFETLAFGAEFQRMFRDAIDAEGNYLEMYQRNLETVLPLSGRNKIAPVDIPGPMHYVPPGFFIKR